MLDFLPLWAIRLLYSKARYCTGLIHSKPCDDIDFVRRVAKILNAKVEYLR